MTLLDLDTDTIQHLDFELEDHEECQTPWCHASVDFDVTHEKSCGKHLKMCGTHTKAFSERAFSSIYSFCECGATFPSYEIIYTPVK